MYGRPSNVRSRIYGSARTGERSGLRSGGARAPGTSSRPGRLPVVGDDADTDTMAREPTAKWQFQSRFRRGAFGWRSQPAVRRVKEAVSEIKKAGRKDPLRAAEGAVRFLERVSPALEHVDGSSGAIGSTVNRAIRELVPWIANAPADEETRAGWLERLYQAHEADGIPYIEELTEHWGELCASKETASRWADRLLERTRSARSPAGGRRSFFHGTTACLSALYAAERYDEILELLEHEAIWPYKRWGVRTLRARGLPAEAIRYAEACRGAGGSDWEVDRVCEDILLERGLAEEAYRRYGLEAHRAGTYLAWFRAVRKRYPHKVPGEILTDLVALTPGQEGKWFAAAKDAELFDEAIELVSRSPTDPRTLTRAARDFAETRPDFAIEAGVAALPWIADGFGYEITGVDVLTAYRHAMTAAAHQGSADNVRQRVREIASADTKGARFVAKLLRPELDGSVEG